jgi:hypothetical protein
MMAVSIVAVAVMPISVMVVMAMIVPVMLRYRLRGEQCQAQCAHGCDELVHIVISMPSLVVFPPYLQSDDAPIRSGRFTLGAKSPYFRQESDGTRPDQRETACRTSLSFLPWPTTA